MRETDLMERFEGVTSEAETEKAVLCRIPGVPRPCWVPKSQISEESEVWKNDQAGVLVVSNWWAAKAGLAEDGRSEEDEDQWHPGHPSNYGDRD